MHRKCDARHENTDNAWEPSVFWLISETETVNYRVERLRNYLIRYNKWETMVADGHSRARLFSIKNCNNKRCEIGDERLSSRSRSRSYAFVEALDREENLSEEMSDGLDSLNISARENMLEGTKANKF